MEWSSAALHLAGWYSSHLRPLCQVALHAVLLLTGKSSSRG